MFKFKYRRKWFWHTYKIVGFKNNKETQRMSLYFKDGSILEIANWDKCDCKLGADYFKILHEKMEQEAGQPIPVKVVV